MEPRATSAARDSDCILGLDIGFGTGGDRSFICRSTTVMRSAAQEPGHTSASASPWRIRRTEELIRDDALNHPYPPVKFLKINGPGEQQRSTALSSWPCLAAPANHHPLMVPGAACQPGLGTAPVRTSSAATSRSLVLVCWEARVRMVNASSSLILCRSIKMPLACSMQARDIIAVRS
jgi:hypothetical protein